MEDNGTWIRTYRGGRFYPFKPSANDVYLEDVAHSLSLICRFGGHCKRFYSVAEHSVRLSQIMNAEYALAALFHDAAEGYLGGDIPNPIKKRFMVEYQTSERRILEEIGIAFGLHIKFFLSPLIKHADKRLAITEARELGVDTSDWEDKEYDVEPYASNVFDDRFGWSPVVAERAFIQRFCALHVKV